MPLKRLLAGTAAALVFASAAKAGPVLMISVDGLRPLDVIEAKQRGVVAPNLERLLHEGAYATGVRNVLPTVTYPNHTTLVTGVWPSRHGIAGNQTFDPLGKNQEGWYWYARDIQVPTLWDAAHAKGLRTASVSWPVTVEAASIDYDIPEIWRAFTQEDAKLLHALSTPGLPEAVAAAGPARLTEMVEDAYKADVAKARAAAAILELKHPAFTTVHIAALDDEEHAEGPGSPKAYEMLTRMDALVGEMVARARKAEPDITIAVVSDHGFELVPHDVNLQAAFVQAGLVTLDDKGKVKDWRAMPWVQGSSCGVVLKDRSDVATAAKVKALLDRLSADPASGVGRVLDRAGVQAMGGGQIADFWVDSKPGYEFGGKRIGDLVTTASPHHGMHGKFPDHPEMRATFIIAGPGVTKTGSLGEIDMRDIAPTLAKILAVPLPSADGKPLF